MSTLKELKGLMEDLSEKKSLEGAFRVVWTDRDHVEHEKIFYNDPGGAPENAKVKAKKFHDKLNAKDKKDKYGFLRGLKLEGPLK